MMARYVFGHRDDEEAPAMSEAEILDHLRAKQQALEARLAQATEAGDLIEEAIRIGGMTDEETRAMAAQAERPKPVSDPMAYRYGQMYVRITRALIALERVAS